MIVDDDLILKLEKLSRIELKKNERAKIKEDINHMIAMFDKIAEIDTNGVEPMMHPNENGLGPRDDKFVAHQNPSELIHLAPQHADNYITVPKVIDI